MSASVARQVAMRGAAILVSALVVVGVGTGVVLHTRQVDALDAALLAAAIGRAHPEVPVDVEIEHTRSPIRAWLVGDGEPRVPADAIRRAIAAEGPLYLDLGDDRYVLLPFEVEALGIESRGVAAATAPRVTLARSLGPFALGYALVAALVATLATIVLVVVVRRAFSPLERARAEVARVLGLAQGARLTEGGPLEVRALLAAVNALLARLEAAHALQARFTAEAAHELRTPVTTLLGELDVALRGERAPEDYRRALVSMREDVTRLRDVVEALTALARIDAGQAGEGRERVRAAEIANQALAREARTLAAAGCPVRLEIDADPELEAHRALLEVALANLLRNAARHAAGAEVVVRVGRVGERVIIDVDDGGPGVAPDAREALFDRFARGASARARDRAGLGLGLPIAREVARRHGGDCTLESSPSGGLRARLSLPVLATERPRPGDF
ncbi:MAG: HAMP domain-containing histidine kinase [Deltaproteobacteria bacterium]|nr:HAMP domain-containing histidine kinase [Deltaproteobacteria bacterium]